MIEWDDLGTGFLDRFFPLEFRDDNVQEFINLKQGNISLKVYKLKFTQLARYAPTMSVGSRARISKFVLGVFKDVVKDFRKPMLVKDIDI